MIDLLVKFKTRIEWLDENKWDYDDTYFAFEKNSNNITNLQKKWSSVVVTPIISKPILQLGKKYKFTFNLDENYLKEFGGAVKLRIGSDESPYFSTIGEHTFESSSTTSKILEIEALSHTSEFSISTIKIEEMGYTKLDIINEDNITLDISVGSLIDDYSERSGIVSNQFTIPSTSINDNFFKNLNIINNENFFNMKVKCPAVLVADDSITLSSGYIVVDELIDNDNQKNYLITFYGEVLNLITELDDVYLNEIDFPEFEHTASVENVTKYGWDVDSDVPYFYPYIDYGNNFGGGIKGLVGSAIDEWPSVGLTVADFYPGVKVKNLMDKIFENYGFTYTSTFFDSDIFKALILPYTNKKTDIGGWNIVTKALFHGPMQLPFNPYEPLNSDIDVLTGKYNDLRNIKCYYDGIPSYHYGDYYVGATNFQSYLTIATDASGKTMEKYRAFNYSPYTTSNVHGPNQFLEGQAKEYNLGYYQTHNNHIPGTYLCQRDGNYRITMEFYLDEYPVAYGYPDLYNTKLFATKIPQSACNFLFNTTPNDNAFNVPSGINSTEECTLIDTYTGTTGTITVEYEFEDCKEGDMIAFKFLKGRFNGYALRGDVNYVQVEEYNWGEDVDVIPSTALPNDYLASNFIKDILLMFNLIIFPDPNNNKNLLIETRDTISEGAEVTDWTQKIDLSRDIIHTPINFYQNKINYLKYDNGDDYYTTYYNDVLDQDEVGFGNTKFNIDSDFVDGENTTTLFAASTPLISDKTVYSNSGTPSFTYSCLYDETYDSDKTISDVDIITKNTPRILFYSLEDIYDNYDSGSTQIHHFMLARNTGHTVGSVYQDNVYPYAGHIRKPYDETSATNMDLNFDTKLQTNGVSQKLYNGDNRNIMTNNNLFNKYWLKTVDLYNNKDTKIMTAYFNLNYRDIGELSLTTKILIDNKYYIIDNISDYSVANNTLCKVQLLEINTNPSEYILYKSGNNQGYDEIHKINTNIILSGKKTDNVTNGENNLILGGSNTTIGNNTLVVGDNNNVGSNSVVLNTSNSTIASGNVVLLSDNIIISDGVEKTTVIGATNKTIKDSGGVYLGANKIIKGRLLQDSGIIDCGHIEVDGILNPYKTGTYLINDSGLNGTQFWYKNAMIVKNAGVGDVNNLELQHNVIVPTLSLTFDDISAFIVDESISDTLIGWNTWFDTSTYADSGFTSYAISGDTIYLYNASNLELKTNLFYNNTRIISVVDNNTVTVFASGVFNCCTSLISVDFPLLTTIGSGGFYGCTSLMSVNFPLLTSAIAGFYGCTSLMSVNLPLLTTVGEGVFYNCTSLTTISLPVATTIGNYGFQNCTSLININFPLVTTIGNYGFQNCTSLININFPLVTTININTFYNCTSLVRILLPKVTTIGAEAFKNCTSLYRLSLPEVTTIGSSWLNGCTSLSIINLPKLISVDSTTFVDVKNTITNISINSVLSIGNFVFDGYTSLTTFEATSTLILGTKSFKDCTSITSVDFPVATSVGDSCFDTCISLTTVNFPLVTTINNRGFYNCISLVTVNFPLVTILNHQCFLYCDLLTNVNFPLVTSIGEGVFLGTSLTNVNFPLVTSVGHGGFGGCVSLTSVSLPVVTSIGQSCFENCYLLSTINFPILTLFDNYVFSNITGNTITLTIPTALNSDTNVTYLQANNTVTIINT